MKRSYLFLVLAFVFLGYYGELYAQTPIENQIFIWPGIAPGSEEVNITEEIEDRDPDGGLCYLNRTVRMVTEPSIKHFAPENPNGSAVLICPGGGYALLAYDKEGYDIAQWYAERDITAFVLKYRLPIDGHADREVVPLRDAQRAMRYIKSNAASFNIDPERIGVMGGSAGGHLAASLSVFYDWETYPTLDDTDTLSAKPAFSVLMYPVISLQDSLTHSGSRSNLLGSTITQLMKDSFSTDLHVDALTPPAFLFHNRYDGSVKYGNSVAYANALENVGVGATLHIYEASGHGQGKCEAGQSAFSHWPINLDEWLVEEGWTTPCLGPMPTITILQQDSVRLLTEAAGSYQWYRNNILMPGATDSLFTPVLTGDYKVAVNGQREESGSDCMIFSEVVTLETITKVDRIEEGRLLLYPNPATSHLQISKLPITESRSHFQVFNSLGAGVLQGPLSPGNQTVSINIQSLSSGLYTLQIIQGNKLYTAHFVKE